MAELTVGGMIRSAFNHEAEGFGGETEAIVAVALACLLTHELRISIFICIMDLKI